MDQFISRITDIVLSFGLIGVVAAVLFLAVYKLYNRNQELHAALQQTGKDSISANMATTAALNKLADQYEGLTRLIETVAVKRR